MCKGHFKNIASTVKLLSNKALYWTAISLRSITASELGREFTFAFINADWRDFQGKSVKEETGFDSILPGRHGKYVLLKDGQNDT